MIPIIRKEIRDAIRNRWVIGYAAAMAVLGFVGAWVGLRTSGEMAFQMFGRTTATLTNLSLLLAPLVAVIMGANAIAGERDRGTLQHLLAQPVDPRELLLGKYIGILIALAAATLVGFAPAAAVIAGAVGAPSLAKFLVFPLIAILLGAAMLALGFVVSIRSRGAAQALGFAIFLWFTFVLLYDLVLMGTLAAGTISTGLLEILLLANPVDAARVLVVLILEPDLYVLGPAGVALISHLTRVGGAVALVLALVLWTAAPLVVSAVLFRRAVVGAPRREKTLSACAIGKELTMKKIAVTTLLLFAAVLLISCGKATESANPEAAAAASATPKVSFEAQWAQGRGVYKTNCAPCHGMAGRGDGPAAANLDPKPRDHTNATVMDTITDKEIRETVQFGGALKGMAQMPSHPHLKPEELDAVVSFVRTLSHPDKAPVAPGTVITAGDAPPAPAVTGQ